MGKYFESVKQRARQRRQELGNDPALLDMMEAADRFLEEKDCFITADLQTSCGILKFLNYADEELFELISMLTFEQIEGTQYLYGDPDPVETEEPSEPEEDPEPQIEEPEPQRDRYYEFAKYGIAKMEPNCRFYLWEDGEWVYSPWLRTYYFEAASDYWELDYVPEEYLHPKKQEVRKDPEAEAMLQFAARMEERCAQVKRLSDSIRSDCASMPQALRNEEILRSMDDFLETLAHQTDRLEMLLDHSRKLADELPRAELF